MKNLIVKKNYNIYYVEDNNEILECSILGKLRKEDIKVGDYVEIDKEKKLITSILDRKNYLIRPSISNIDQCFVIISAKNPDFSTNFLDKMLCILEFNKIRPIICITKMDLLEDNSIDIYLDYYKKIGYEIIFNTEIDKIKKIIEDKITVFTGESGVGKSTLLNKLEDFNLKTNKISEYLKRGKHTTINIELFKLNNGYIADTPGFSCIECIDMNKYDIRDNFIEFNNYKDKCKYRDCMHILEDNCYIKDNNVILKSRYDNYKKIVGDL